MYKTILNRGYVLKQLKSYVRKRLKILIYPTSLYDCEILILNAYLCKIFHIYL